MFCNLSYFLYLDAGAKELLQSLSEKQGKQMNSAESAKDIPKFIKFFEAWDFLLMNVYNLVTMIPNLHSITLEMVDNWVWNNSLAQLNPHDIITFTDEEREKVLLLAVPLIDIFIFQLVLIDVLRPSSV